MHYDGDNKLFVPLSTAVVSTYYITNFKVLESFNKTRIARIKVFSLMRSTNDNERSVQNISGSFSDIKLIEESVVEFSYEDELINNKNTIFGDIFMILNKKEDMSIKNL